MSASDNLLTTNYENNPNLSITEQKILQQYQHMNQTLLKISNELESLTRTTTDLGQEKGTSIQVINNLRQLETKLVFVYTFFKSAVYSIINEQEYSVQQEDDDDGYDANAPLSDISDSEEQNGMVR
ncbi:DASH complex subunit DAD2 [Candida maltosa Xu316]|uniref:DASH complex subunit DAD3 n=1 Tax=Candida maltosa (strain Xu316) TaxID=1245528 RepID=M3K256_CANMX|nr:DASH complex subunit DAD2 [Candida maltosa Xu316]